MNPTGPVRFVSEFIKYQRKVVNLFFYVETFGINHKIFHENDSEYMNQLKLISIVVVYLIF